METSRSPSALGSTLARPVPVFAVGCKRTPRYTDKSCSTWQSVSFSISVERRQCFAFEPSRRLEQKQKKKHYFRINETSRCCFIPFSNSTLHTSEDYKLFSGSVSETKHDGKNGRGFRIKILLTKIDFPSAVRTHRSYVRRRRRVPELFLNFPIICSTERLWKIVVDAICARKEPGSHAHTVMIAASQLPLPSQNIPQLNAKC